MRSSTMAASAAALAVFGTLGLAAPASAAPEGPSPNASCVGTVFVPQALGEPGAIADRIAFIKAELLLEDESFGDVLHGLARIKC